MEEQNGYSMELRNRNRSDRRAPVTGDASLVLSREDTSSGSMVVGALWGDDGPPGEEREASPPGAPNGGDGGGRGIARDLPE